MANGFFQGGMTIETRTSTAHPRAILCVIGTRPEAIKLAPVIRHLRKQSWAQVRVVVTAQHRQLLDPLLGFLGIQADVDLDIMQPNQSLSDLTSRLSVAMDAVLRQENPDIVLAQGDTTTVMVSALCCFYRRIRFGHVEAGLRTGEKYSPFPEEVNRVLVADLSDIHFAPSESARANLRCEGIEEDRIVVTGNTAVDALLWTAKQNLPTSFEGANGRRLLLVTAHRRENIGAPLEEICDALRELAGAHDVEIIFPVHPNPNVSAIIHRRLAEVPHIRLVPPLDYPRFVAAMKASYLILTDSGGIQEEAPSLGKPVLVLRDTTERPEGVAAGASCLVGPHRSKIVSKTVELLNDAEAYRHMAQVRNPFGDGHAAERITNALRRFLDKAARVC